MCDARLWRGAVAALTVPVLYMCGSEDTLCPPERHRKWAQITPDAQFTEIPGAGHMLPLEAPQDFAETLKTWLNNNKEEFA